MQNNIFITIIGAGEIGRAIHSVLAKKSFNVEIWDRTPDKVPQRKSLEETIPHSNVVFLCIPSWAIRDVAVIISPLLKKNTLVVTVSKGIDAQTGKTIDELMEELFGSVADYALLGGAMLAEELIEKFGIGVIGTRKKKNFELLKRIFADTHLHLEFNDDLHGVALCGIFKNIYAILLGVAEGLGFGNNAKGWLVSQSIKEMGELIVFLGGKKETVLSNAGVGDFIATGFSDYSSNRQVGKELATNGTIGKKSEGIVSLPFIVERIDNINNFPLLKMINTIVESKQVSKDTLKKIFAASN